MSEAVATETTTETTETEAAATETKAAETTTATETTTEAPAFDYGKWADGLTDESKKDYARRFKSLDEVIDGALAMRKDVSSRIKVPGENATPEEKAAFNKAIGASDNVEDYKVATPENYELGEAQTALVGLMKQKAAEAGVPVSAFENFTKTYFEAEVAIKEKIEGEVKSYREETEKALRKEHGKDYDRRLAAGNALLDKLDKSGEVRAFLNDNIQWNGVAMKAGDHPALMSVIAELGLRMAEDGAPLIVTQDERSSIHQQINEIRKNNPVPYSQAVNRQLEELYAKLG